MLALALVDPRLVAVPHDGFEARVRHQAIGVVRERRDLASSNGMRRDAEVVVVRDIDATVHTHGERRAGEQRAVVRVAERDLGSRERRQSPSGIVGRRELDAGPRDRRDATGGVARDRQHAPIGARDRSELGVAVEGDRRGSARFALRGGGGRVATRQIAARDAEQVRLAPWRRELKEIPVRVVVERRRSTRRRADRPWPTHRVGRDGRRVAERIGHRRELPVRGERDALRVARLDGLRNATVLVVNQRDVVLPGNEPSDDTPLRVELSRKWSAIAVRAT